MTVTKQRKNLNQHETLSIEIKPTRIEDNLLRLEQNITEHDKKQKGAIK